MKLLIIPILLLIFNVKSYSQKCYFENTKKFNQLSIIPFQISSNGVGAGLQYERLLNSDNSLILTIPVTYLYKVFIPFSIDIKQSGYAINPARDLGPRIVYAVLPINGKVDCNWRYSWIPVLGPIIGGTLAALFYIEFN